MRLIMTFCKKTSFLVLISSIISLQAVEWPLSIKGNICLLAGSALCLKATWHAAKADQCKKQKEQLKRTLAAQQQSFRQLQEELADAKAYLAHLLGDPFNNFSTQQQAVLSTRHSMEEANQLAPLRNTLLITSHECKRTKADKQRHLKTAVICGTTGVGCLAIATLCKK